MINKFTRALIKQFIQSIHKSDGNNESTDKEVIMLIIKDRLKKQEFTKKHHIQNINKETIISTI